MTTARLVRPALTAVLLVTGLLVTSTACGTARPATGDTTATTSPATSTTPSTDIPSTTDPTTTDTATTGPDDTTSIPVVPTDAWTPISFEDAGMPLAYPCCASNWGLDAPSPPLPAAGESLADGVYSIEWEWPADIREPVIATVNRFDRCNELPAGHCQEQPDYFDDEYGVASGSVDIELRFDDSLRVILGGYVGFEYPDKSSALQIGTGTALADLITHLEVDYQAAVVEAVLAGTDPWDLAQLLGASPEHGFSLPLGEGPEMGQVVYTYLDAPPLLYQALVRIDVDPADARGSDNIGRIALRVEGGAYTVSVYSGWYS